MVAKTIGILSLKGGVGKTSSVVALGDAISGFGKKVLLVDGNLSAPNLGTHLNIREPKISLHHVLRGEANATDALHNLGDFDVLPSSLFSKTKTSPLKLKDKLNHLRNFYDFIIIDSSPSMSEETLAVMIASDELIVVTTPDLPTLNMTIKAVKVAKQRGNPIMGMIVNKVHDKKFEVPTAYIEKSAGVPVMAVIPQDVNMLKALSEYVPYTKYKSSSVGSKEYKKLAAVLVGEKYKPFSVRGLFRMTPKLQDVNRELFYERVF